MIQTRGACTLINECRDNEPISQKGIRDEKISMKVCGQILIKASTAGCTQKLVVKRAQGMDEIWKHISLAVLWSESDSASRSQL